jgi:hypothetical protein
MALAILKFAGGIARGVGNFIKKQKAKKTAKVEKAVAKQMKKQQSIDAIGGFDLGGGTSAIKQAAANLMGSAGGAAGLAAFAKEDGEVITAKGLPFDWKNPVVLVGLLIAVIFLLPKLLGGRRR